jgi:hypothetical protein
VFDHQGQTDDSYLSLNEDVFGQVEDIMFVPEKSAAIILLRRFAEKELLTEGGARIEFPMNQFPVTPTDTFATIIMDADAYVTKIVRSELIFKDPRRVQIPHIMFAIRPNPWFRF